MPICKNCGCPLDPFGICPRAKVEDVKTSAAPVYCRPEPHPDLCCCPKCQRTRWMLAA